VFSGLLTVQARDMWNALDRPDPFTVVDLGAGEGALARGILTAATTDEEFARALNVVAVERSEIARNAIKAKGHNVAASLDDLEPFTGLIVANELFDNVPFRLFTQDVEITITAEGDRLIWQPLPMSEIWPVSSASDRIVDEIARVLKKGYALIIDYGFAGGEKPEAARGYRAHHLVEDLLEDPGANDITGPVDFDALAVRAASNALQAWGPVSQRDALMALGYRATLDRMRTDQADKERTGEWRTAIGYYGERGQAAMLVDPSGLGGLKVLGLGSAGLPAPRSLD